MSDHALSGMVGTDVRPIWLSPFGRYTRYMLAGYLRHVLIVTSILLAIALTIDLWPQFQDVAARGHDTLSAVWSVVRFSGLRTPGLIAPLLPFATFKRTALAPFLSFIGTLC